LGQEELAGQLVALVWDCHYHGICGLNFSGDNLEMFNGLLFFRGVAAKARPDHNCQKWDIYQLGKYLQAHAPADDRNDKIVAACCQEDPEARPTAHDLLLAMTSEV
jgi:hypothetical protein